MLDAAPSFLSPPARRDSDTEDLPPPDPATSAGDTLIETTPRTAAELRALRAATPVPETLPWSGPIADPAPAAAPLSSAPPANLAGALPAGAQPVGAPFPFAEHAGAGAGAARAARFPAEAVPISEADTKPGLPETRLRGPKITSPLVPPMLQPTEARGSRTGTAPADPLPGDPSDSSNAITLPGTRRISTPTRGQTPVVGRGPEARPAEPRGGITPQQRATAALEAGRPPPGAATNGHAPDPLDAMAASWRQPVLPAGESPWSEIIHTRGTHTRLRDDFPGFPGDIPIPPLTERRPLLPPPPEAYPPAPTYDGVPTSEIEIEVDAALRSFNARKIALATICLLATFGLFALLSRTGGGPMSDAPLATATPANEVTLDSEPPGATVIAEADGAMLGKTPLRFLVPPEVQAAVYVTAPGREPIRLLLPERGGITAQLAKLDAPACALPIGSAEGVTLEGVGFDLGPGPVRTVPGAGVVRARAGEQALGARLVLCPGLGGSDHPILRFGPRPGVAAVRITEPEGLYAYLNGDPLGAVPAVSGSNRAFSQVQVNDPQGNVEVLYVPTQEAVEVHMPTPRAHPVPVVMAPDSSEQVLRPASPGPAEDLAFRAGPDRRAAGGPETDRAVADAAPSGPERAAAERADANGASPERLEGARAERDGEARAEPLPGGRVRPSKPRSVRARELMRAGKSYLDSHALQRAKELFNACVAYDPVNAECHLYLGDTYRQLRLPHKMREHYRRYLELAPDGPRAAEVRRRLPEP